MTRFRIGDAIRQRLNRLLDMVSSKEGDTQRTNSEHNTRPDTKPAIPKADRTKPKAFGPCCQL